MDGFEFTLTLVALVMGGVIVTSLISTIGKVVTRRRESPLLREASIDRLDERLGRMEQGIDAMAVEVERISEAQRFTTRLLAERGERIGT